MVMPEGEALVEVVGFGPVVESKAILEAVVVAVVVGQWLPES